MTTWTKEQLKTLARVATTDEKEEEEVVEPFLEDVSKFKRKINTRAVPKVIFSTIVLTPLFGFAYIFANSNLNLAKNNEVKAAEPDSQTKELEEQLEASLAKIEQLEAKLAVIKQEQPYPEPEVVKEIPPPKAEVKTVVNSQPVAQPPPPKQRIVNRRTAPPPVKIPPRRLPTKTVAKKQTPKLPPIIQGTGVYGASSPNDGRDLTTQSKASVVADRYGSQEEGQFVRAINSSYSNSTAKNIILASAVNNFPSINPELEASFLQEKSVVVLKTGASTKAELAVPWVQDLRGIREDKVISVVLSQPLKGARGKIFLPAQTTIVVRAESLGQPDILEFVGEYAYLPTNSEGVSTKIMLPEGAIRFSDISGQPLVALPLRNKSSRSQGGGLLDVLDTAEGVWQVSNRLGWRDSDDIVGDVLQGQREIRSRLRQKERYEYERIRSIVFLPKGTQLKLYVEREVAVESLGY